MSFFNDPIAEMLNNIKNASLRNHKSVSVAFSKLKLAIVLILLHQNVIKGYTVLDMKGHKRLLINLRYKDNCRLFNGFQRVSKLGLRVYKPYCEIYPFRNGFGFAIISTSHGLLTDRQSRDQKVGGEVLAYI